MVSKKMSKFQILHHLKSDAAITDTVISRSSYFTPVKIRVYKSNLSKLVDEMPYKNTLTTTVMQLGDNTDRTPHNS